MELNGCDDVFEAMYGLFVVLLGCVVVEMCFIVVTN